MYVIKPCPNCGAKLRFPINSGTVKVTCKCGYSFIANPDNPRLYSDAVFDLWYDSKPKPKASQTSIISRVIERLYSYWYTILNFRLLPTKTQRTIIVIIIIIILLVMALFYLLFSSPPQPPSGGITV